MKKSTKLLGLALVASFSSADGPLVIRPFEVRGGYADVVGRIGGFHPESESARVSGEGWRSNGRSSRFVYAPELKAQMALSRRRVRKSPRTISSNAS